MIVAGRHRIRGSPAFVAALNANPSAAEVAHVLFRRFSDSR